MQVLSERKKKKTHTHTQKKLLSEIAIKILSYSNFLPVVNYHIILGHETVRASVCGIKDLCKLGLKF